MPRCWLWQLVIRNRRNQLHPRNSKPPRLNYASLQRIEERLDGRLGVTLVDSSGEVLESYRGNERFAMCSTFKLALGAAILERAEAGELSMEDNIEYDSSDVLEYAPITGEHVDEGSMTVRDLAAAISTHSDNTAANLLLERIGGPSVLTRFFREHGDDVTRLDRTEPDLNENAPGDARDTTTPDAMAGLVQRLIFGDAMTEQARGQIADWAIANTTGDQRIRAGIPEGWRVGDKTGTCWSAYNDVAIVWPPNGDPFILAVYIDRPDTTPRQINRAMAEIGAMAARYMGG